MKDWRRYFRRRPDQLINAANAVAVVDVNQMTLDVYRAPSKEDVVVHARGENTSPDELTTFREEFIAFAEGAASFDIDTTERALDGSDIFTRVHAVISPRHRDDWSQVLHTIEDITKSKRAEEALRKSEARLSAIIDHAPVQIYLKDRDGRHIMVSEESERLYGEPAGGVVGKSAHDLFPKECAEVHLAHDRAVFESREASEWDYVIPETDGIRTYLTVKFPIPDADGEIGIIGAIATDITGRKRIEEALREHEERLKAVIDHSPNAISLKRTDGRYLLLNRQYEKIANMASDEARGKRSYEIFAKEFADSGVAQDCAVLESGWAIDREEDLLLEDGVHTLLTVKFPVHDGDGNIVSVGAISTDITERKRAEEALRKAHEGLELRLEETTRELRAINTQLLDEIGERKQVEKALKEGEARYRAIFEDSPGAVWEEDWSTVKAMLDDLAKRGVKDLRRYFDRRRDQLIKAYDLALSTEISRATIEMYGAPSKQALIDDTSGAQATASELDGFRDTLVALYAGATSYEYETADTKFDKTELLTLTRGALPPARRDDWSRVLFSVVDITERKRAEKALRESEARLAEACRIAKIGHWAWDEKEDRQVYCSAEGERIFGVPPGTVFADFDELLAMIHPDDRQRVEALIDQAHEDRTGHEVEYRIIRPDGETHFVLEHAEVELDDAGEFARTVGTVQDITERKEAEQRVAHLAHNDSLTGLPNRTLFEDRLEKAMANAQRHGQHLAVHFMDLNRFKEVNDTLGHAVGDELLKAVGATLKGVVRNTDSVARFGGDEFTVVQTELDGPEGATILAQKIVDALGQPFLLADHEVRTGVTIGVALYPNDGTEAGELLQNADFALYEGKAKGQDTYEFFDAEMRAALVARKSLEEDIARALEREEFMVYYQPRIDLASGLIIGVEALVRWNHPERGVVSPGEFIPVAETSGLIRPLGEWVLRTACSDTAAWRDAGLPPMSVAVNLSTVQFHQTDLVALVSDVLDASGLTPGQLELEITETMMMNERDTKVIPTLRRLRDLGIQISVDDFGTGYASLTYLRQLPVSKVKVDLSFVQGITHDSADKAIVEAVIRLGHGLNLEVTAEGVETEEQATLLKAWNCDEAQGYLFSRPVPAVDLTALLEAQAST